MCPIDAGKHKSALQHLIWHHELRWFGLYCTVFRQVFTQLTGNKEKFHIFQTFSTTPSLPVSSPSIWQDTVWKASTQHPLEKSTPCFYGLLGIMKLFLPTFIHTLTLMLLLPCMPGELNKVSVWILPSICEAVFFQVLPPMNLAFNQSTNTLANTSGFWEFLLRRRKKKKRAF